MNPLTCTNQHTTASKTEIQKTKRHGKSEGQENRVHSKTLKFKVSKNVVPVLHNETPRKIIEPIMTKFEVVPLECESKALQLICPNANASNALQTDITQKSTAEVLRSPKACPHSNKTVPTIPPCHFHIE